MYSRAHLHIHSKGQVSLPRQIQPLQIEKELLHPGATELLHPSTAHVFSNIRKSKEILENNSFSSDLDLCPSVSTPQIATESLDSFVIKISVDEHISNGKCNHNGSPRREQRGNTTPCCNGTKCEPCHSHEKAQ